LNIEAQIPINITVCRAVSVTVYYTRVLEYSLLLTRFLLSSYSKLPDVATRTHHVQAYAYWTTS